MNDWDRYVEEWFNASYIAFSDYEFDSMKQELLVAFDKLDEEFDRTFDDDLNEFEFSKSYMEVRSETLREEVDVLLYGSYALNLRPNKKARVCKNKRTVRPVSVKRRNHHNSDYYNLADDDNFTGSKVSGSRIKREGRESLEDVIVSDENIKVVLQLPINNRKENIKVVAYSDNSIAISHLSSEGKQRRYTSVIPYSIDIETARSTYRNGILEITFNRK
jgi:HSP20 family molecular chaperone IbpA